MTKIEKKKETLFMHSIMQDWAEYDNVIIKYSPFRKNNLPKEYNLQSYKDFELIYWSNDDYELYERIAFMVNNFTDNIMLSATLSNFIENAFLTENK